MTQYDYNKNNSKTAGNIRLFPAQLETQSFGSLQVRCTSPDFLPIANASVIISYPGEPGNVVEQLTTNDSGLTETISLPAPSIDYSLAPTTVQPYSLYDVRISAPQFDNITVSSVEILPDVTAEQDAELTPVVPPELVEELFVIPPHTLFGDYPPKIPEDEIKPTAETGEIVLSRVVIPEYVIVHDGPPTDAAANYWVRFRDYIKNVASSEIYATWPENTIYANVFAILSFTLNRVYTEWYRNKGFNFTITSSTAYDHKWIRGRNIYTNIGLIVDSVFVNYLSRPNVKQPILTQYCDGNRTQCPNWLSQWGSKSLGDQGYTPIQILRYYYGSSIYINTAIEVSGVPASWPGHNLTIGARGGNVRMIQEQLNRISQAYPAIPKIAVDGVYGAKTADAVRAYQRIFGLPATGIVDFPTWYKISAIYVGVARLAQ